MPADDSGEEEVVVDELSSRPTDFWKRWTKTAKVMRLQVRPPSSPPEENKLRFVCMADTHSLTSHLKMDVPPGDVFIHAGDFTRCGSIQEVREFSSWLAKLPHQHKIVIAGNHELSFDPALRGLEQELSLSMGRCGHTGGAASGASPMHTVQSPEKAMDRAEVRAELRGCTYLEDSSVTIRGVKIYGTPWQPEFSGWAFNLPRGADCLRKWQQVPADTDVLITHTPPVGFGDLCSTGVRAGCVELLHSVQKRIKPKYHVYGHIHEGYGVRSDGKILFINASTCDINYLPCNPPVVFDVTIPPTES